MYSEGNITAEKVYIIRDQGQTHLIYDGTVYEMPIIGDKYGRMRTHTVYDERTAIECYQRTKS
jgi:hypothetical protein